MKRRVHTTHSTHTTKDFILSVVELAFFLIVTSGLTGWAKAMKALIFRRSFVKRFALCYRTIGPLSCLPVMLVYCGQTVGWIKIKLGMEVGISPCHIVLDGDPAPQKKGQSPQFSAHVCCGQTAGWIKIPLGTG